MLTTSQIQLQRASLFLLFTLLLFPYLLSAQVQPPTQPPAQVQPSAQTRPPAQARPSAPTRHTVSGTIRDKNSGETLIGASVIFLEHPHAAVLSNAYGFYSINAAAGNYKMIVSFAGYQSDTLSLALDRDIQIPASLPPALSIAASGPLAGTPLATRSTTATRRSADDRSARSGTPSG